MPLVAFTQLPTFDRLKQQNHDVLSVNKANHQDIRELHIGLLNMMPDASLQATERQFMRLLGDCNQIIQIYVHLFTLPSISRSEETKAWINDFYESFDSIKSHGLDALVITGANPVYSELEQEAFWPELTQVIDWAKENVTSVLCACLASHAVLQYLYGIKRKPLKEKKWGVFQHQLTNVEHPLTRHINTRFDVPHSRLNQITSEQLAKNNLINLSQSEDAGVHLAASNDGVKFIFFQGHPEYDATSLLKEYKREIDRWSLDERTDYPPFPDNYFDDGVKQKLNDYRKTLESCCDRSLVEWPDEWLQRNIDNTWRDTALSTFNNWLGLIYQLTGKNIKQPYMAGIDPENPLNIKQ